MSVAMNEQETVIRFGRDSEECEIYTSDTTVMTKLDKLASKNNDKAPLWKLKEEHRTKATHELVGKTYTTNKRLISFRAGIVERLRKWRENNKTEETEETEID